ncbi:MAG: cyclase [Acidobacteria bacterium]|nr:MAG: cyclase [Acidobacteriota bacterium]
MTTDFKLIDVSHSIEHGMITYKGLPTPAISDHLTRDASRTFYESGTEFHIGKIEMVANTGTYLDSPFHRYPDGTDLAGLDLSSLANLAGLVIRHTGQNRAIEISAFGDFDLKGKAVLIHTGWDKHWRTDEYWSGNHPFVTEEAAKFLVDAGATLVGIDSYNIDDTSTGSRPAHTILLANSIPIVEHLCDLDKLPESGFRFFAVPVKVRNFGTFPVRAFGIVQ